MEPLHIVDFSTLNQVLDFTFALILICIVLYICIRLRFMKNAIIGITLLLTMMVVAWILNLNLTLSFLIIIITAFVFILALSHTGAIRSFFARNIKADLLRKTMPDKIVDRQALYEELEKAVVACSRQKIGALITLERHDDLKSITKNGTVINAPVTAELLTTIFYPGTRLHDGAIIIKENLVYAASVYYTPTTKALTGKFGSRHRAAIGISEISDSVTIVVSEETGRVSIAQYGEIEAVNLDEFVKVLSEHMSDGE